MRIHIFLAISCFLLQPITAQSVIDSLERKLPGSEGKDRVEILIGLANEYYSSNPSKAIIYSEDAYELSLSENEQELMAESLRLIGFSYFYAYDFLEAAKYLTQSLKTYSYLGNEMEAAKISQNIGLAYLQANEYDSSGYYLNQSILLHAKFENLKEIAYCHTNLGLLNYMKSDYASALEHYNKASEIYKNIDDPENLANLLNRIGMTYWSLGIHEKAIAFALESVKERENIGKPEKLATGYNNIGAIYKEMGENEKALEYFNLAILQYQLASDSMGMPSALTNIGNVYKTRNIFDSALVYYYRAIVISKAVGDEFQTAKTRHNIGTVFLEMGQLDSAIICIQNYLTYSTKIGNKEGVTVGMLNLGRVYFEKGDLNKANDLIEQSIHIADSLNLLPILQSSYAELSKLREAENNYTAALEYNKLSTQLNDSLFNIEKTKVISEMETKYETEKKEKDNKLLKKDIEFEKGKSYFLLVLTIVLIIMGIISLILFYFIRKNILTRRQLARSEASRLEAELESQKRELTLGALSVSRNLEFINSLINELKELTDNVNEEGLQPLNNIVKKLTQQQSDSSWKEFEKRFSEIHSDFYSRLINKYPALSQSEVKLSAFLKLGMNTKEICSITFQSVRAVEAARLRLRKKLTLSDGENLCMFLQKL